MHPMLSDLTLQVILASRHPIIAIVPVAVAGKTCRIFTRAKVVIYHFNNNSFAVSDSRKFRFYV